MLPPITKLKRVALDLLFPPWCIGCGREGNYICDSCRQQLPLIVPPCLSQVRTPLSRESTIVPAVSKHRAEIDGIRAPFLFNGVIRQAIHELKYRNLRAVAPLLAGFLNDFLLENPVPGDVLVPVPIHRKRQRERGYNQSSLLARELGSSRLAGGRGLPRPPDLYAAAGKDSQRHRPPEKRRRRLRLPRRADCRANR